MENVDTDVRVENVKFSLVRLTLLLSSASLQPMGQYFPNCTTFFF